MDDLILTKAQQIAQAASLFQQQRTGHTPQAVTVVLSSDTLVITLHGALSEAEKALSRDPAGAAQVQDFHRQLFAKNNEELRQAIKTITGVAVREAAAEVETSTGAVVHAFTAGTMVQVFLLTKNVATEFHDDRRPGIGGQLAEAITAPIGGPKALLQPCHERRTQTVWNDF